MHHYLLNVAEFDAMLPCLLLRASKHQDSCWFGLSLYPFLSLHFLALSMFTRRPCSHLLVTEYSVLPRSCLLILTYIYVCSTHRHYRRSVYVKLPWPRTLYTWLCQVAMATYICYSRVYHYRLPTACVYAHVHCWCGSDV